MKYLLSLALLMSIFTYSQTFTESNPTAHSGDGSGIYVTTSGYRTANDITVDPNVDFTLNQISFNLVVYSGGTVDSVTATYYDDNNGEPGNIIGTQEDIVPSSQNVFYVISEYGIDVKQVVLAVNPIVLNGTIDQATTYWISLVATVSDTAIAWWELTQGSTMGNRIFEYKPSEGAWVRKGYGDGVYEFSGTMATMAGLSCNPIDGNPENFETADITTHCWTLYNLDSNDSGFEQTGDQAQEGGFSFYHASTDLSADASSFLVSPAISVNFFDVLSFWYYQHNTANFGMSKVLVSTTSNDPLNNPDDFTTLVSLDETAIGGFSEDTWTEHIENLRNYAGETIYIAFMYSGDLSHELYIDNFSVLHDNMAWDETEGAMRVTVLPENTNINYTDNFVIGSNLNATDSSTINGTPACGSFNGGDIWIKFTAPETGAVQMAYPLYTSFAFSELGYALYDNPLSTETIFCGINGNMWNETLSNEEEFVYLTGLTVGKTYYLRIWDSNNDNFGNFYFCLKEYTDPNASVEEINLTGITVFPNPTTGKVSIQSSEAIQINNVTIFDISGRIISNEKIKTTLNNEIDLSRYNSGAYFIRINSNNETIVYKVIKK